jgi:YegS/Rv2252/BmrU family lipid kinase
MRDKSTKKTTDPHHAVFIINPVSGIGDSKKRKDEIVQIAKNLGWKGKIFETTKIKNAGVIATEQINAGAKHLVICGGDGTIMEALQVIINTNIVLGIVPLGTGNLFAQNLGITGSRKAMIERALFGTPKKIDVGRANDTIFAIIAGIGFDAEVMKEANRKLKDRFGPFAYLIIGLKILYRRPGLYSVSIDKKRQKIFRAKSIMIANMGKLQGGIEAVPNAHWQNGILRIGIIKASAFPAWLSLLGSALIGNINKSPHYTLLKGKHVEIVSLSGKKPYQCDGNHFPATRKLTVEVLPRAVSVLVDKNAKGAGNNLFTPILQFQKRRVYWT